MTLSAGKPAKGSNYNCIRSVFRVKPLFVPFFQCPVCLVINRNSLPAYRLFRLQANLHRDAKAKGKRTNAKLFMLALRPCFHFKHGKGNTICGLEAVVPANTDAPFPVR